MTSKKGQAHKQCNIYQWIESQDSEFAGAIRQLCLESALVPNWRAAGVTFLYPGDAKFRAEIIDHTYSEKADEAERILKSLIIPDVLAQCSDFERRPIGSKLGVKYNVESASNGKVKFTNGTELAAATNFNPLASRADKIAVWVITKGRPPLTGESYKAPAPNRKVDGGGRAVHGGEPEPLSYRAQMAGEVENAFHLCMMKDRCRSHNPYLGKVVSLLNYLKAKSNEVFTKILPILDYDPAVTFYLLLEPYKKSGEYLIPENLLFANGWNGGTIYGDAVEEYKAIFRSMPTMTEMSATDSQSGMPLIPYVFRDRRAVAAQIDISRRQINATNGREVGQLVQDVYAILSTNNTIQGMGPILPDSTKAALGGSKKLWQDEYRFIIHQAMEELRQMPDYAQGGLNVFTTVVQSLRFSWPGNNYSDEIVLSNLKDLKTNVAPRDDQILLAKFINSTDFLYMPFAPEAVGGTWGSMNPTDWEVYNRNAVALRTLSTHTGMVNPTGVSANTLQELELYKQIHGVLPPQVLALHQG
jgi:hypothetical protein